MVFPINQRKVVFSSFAGKQYADNPKAISEKLHNIHPEAEIVWLMKGARKVNQLLPDYVKVVEYESFAAAYELFTSKVWVDNIRKPLFFRKRKKQFYLQTWHGTPLKLIEADAGDKLGKKYRKYAKRDSKNISILLSGNQYSTAIFRKAFEYEGEMLECGTPRNDLLLNNCEQIGLQVRKKLNCENQAVLLFAPTYRNDIEKNGLEQLKKLDPNVILDAYEKKYNKKCVLFLRFHPNVADTINMKAIIMEYGERVRDVSVMWDMQELLCAADALITDYSSVFFDYSILKRPIFIFTPDKNNYYDERGLYLDVNELPLFSSETSEQLVYLIRSIDKENLIERTSLLLNQIGNKEEGIAAEKAVQIIKKQLEMT